MVKKIRIGSSVYDVVMKEHIYDEEVKMELYGSIDTRKGVIELWKGSCGIRLEETLLHEIIHGICNHYQVEIEEKTVEMLGKGLVDLFLDNPGLIEGMISSINEKISTEES